MRTLRIILNAKAVEDAGLWDAVARIRAAGHRLQVRVTGEAGDAVRLAAEAEAQGVEVVVAAGGDGTLNEVVNGLMEANKHPSAAVAILPLGTANDFAASCGIPSGVDDALLLAATGPAVPIDVARANGSYFVNMASGVFGAEIAPSAQEEMKHRFGRSAYALMGFLSLLQRPKPARTSFRMPEETFTESFLLGAIGNGRQAGGGFQVTPEALLDDGLLDILLVRRLGPEDLDTVIDEMSDPAAPGNRFTLYRRVPWLELGEAQEGERFLNLDGEPFTGSKAAVRFQVLQRRLRVILPKAADPMLQQPVP